MKDLGGVVVAKVFTADCISFSLSRNWCHNILRKPYINDRLPAEQSQRISILESEKPAITAMENNVGNKCSADEQEITPQIPRFFKRTGRKEYKLIDKIINR